jgi:hypothetical protein
MRQHLRPVLASDVLLASDANKAYQAFARQTGISHAYGNVSAANASGALVTFRTSTATTAVFISG